MLQLYMHLKLQACSAVRGKHNTTYGITLPVDCTMVRYTVLVVVALLTSMRTLEVHINICELGTHAAAALSTYRQLSAHVNHDGG